MGKKMFVGGLPYEVDDAKLREIFAPHGKVVSARVIMDRETGRSKGFGFVEMSTDDEAKAATAKLNNSAVGERKIFVNEARPMEARPRPSPGGPPSGGPRPSFGGAQPGFGAPVFDNDRKKRDFGPDKKRFSERKGGYGKKSREEENKGAAGKKGRREEEGDFKRGRGGDFDEDESW
jgi:RNA recognition motif-containing protein